MNFPAVAPRHNIDALTGLRGIAAIWVVLYHLAGGTSLAIVSDGYMGVDVFFILSGFILCYVYADRLAPDDFRGYLSFLRARVARIYPLHLLALAVLGTMVVFVPHFAASYPQPHQRFGLGPFFASVLLIQNWAYWLPTCWNTPAWSLSAEWLASLAFPAFIVITQRWRSSTVPLCLAAASLLTFVVVLHLKGIRQPGEGTPGMLRMACEFTCGCLLYRAMANGLQRLSWHFDALALALLLLAVLSSKVFLALPAFGLIVLLAAQERGCIARFLASAPMVFLGEISYSVYILHWTIIQAANRSIDLSKLGRWQTVAYDGIVLLVIVALSAVTYRYLEQPARRWVTKFSLQRSVRFAG